MVDDRTIRAAIERALQPDYQIRLESEPLPWDFTRLSQSLITATTKVLDIGTGDGRQLARTLTNQKHAWAIEPLEEWFLKAQKTFATCSVPIESHLCDVNGPYLFEDKFFDVVFASRSSYNPAEVARVLVPGGVFLTQQVCHESRRNFLKALKGMDWDSGPNLYPAILDDLRRVGLVPVCHGEGFARETFAELADVIAFLWRNQFEFTFEPWKEIEGIRRLAGTCQTQRGFETTWHCCLVRCRKEG